MTSDELLKEITKVKIFQAFLILMPSILFFFFKPDPSWDLFRHYERYLWLLDDPNNYFLQNMYFGYSYWQMIFVKLNLPKEMLAVASSIILNFSVFKLFNSRLEPISVYYSSSNYILASLLLTLSFPLLHLVSGQRFLLALSFFLIGVSSKGKTLKYIFFTISLCFHYTFILPLLVYFLSSISPSKTTKAYSVVFFSCLVLGLVLPTIILYLNEFLQSVLPTQLYTNLQIDKYILGRYGAEQGAELNENGNIGLWLVQLFLITLCLAYYFRPENDKFLNVFICFLLLTSSFGALGRFTVILYIFMAILALQDLIENRKSVNTYCILMIITFNYLFYLKSTYIYHLIAFNGLFE
ncbi:EpsG family protein [Vibrio breoganii]